MTFEFLRSPDIWIIITIIFTAAILFYIYYPLRFISKTRFLVVLRILVLSILIICLLQPRISRKIVNVKNLEWNLYLDNSISMGYHQSQSLVSLNEQLKSFINSLENRNITMNINLFSNDVVPYESGTYLDGQGASTDLGKVLKHIEDSRRYLGGAIIVSDGQATQGEDPLALAKQAGVPIIMLGLGDMTPMVDVAIQTVDVPTVTIKGDDVNAVATIISTGITNERVNVTLYQGKKMIGSRFVTVEGDGAQSKVHFQFTPNDLGKLTYHIRISSLADEINVLNNRLSFDLSVLKDNYRVALITGSPNLNTQIIKKMLNQMPRVEFDHYIQSDTKFIPGLRSFWEKPYELIILDDYPNRKLTSQWQRYFARKLLSHKSALAWFVGPSVTPEPAKSLYPFFRIKQVKSSLDNSQVYPVELSTTEPGSDIWNAIGLDLMALDMDKLPPISPGLAVDSDHPETKILANLKGEDELPLLLFGQKESMRYSVWTSPDLYSYYYKLTGTEQADFILNFGSRLLGWVMKTSGDNDMYFRLDKDSYQQGELITVTGNKIGDRESIVQAAITLFKDNENVNSTELQYNPEKKRWEGQLLASIPGDYSYEISVIEKEGESYQVGDFKVQESQIELNHVYLNSRLMQRMAKISGGEYIPWLSRAKIFSIIQPKSVAETSYAKINIVENLWILIGVILLLSGEWILRRKWGLS